MPTKAVKIRGKEMNRFDLLLDIITLSFVFLRHRKSEAYDDEKERDEVREDIVRPSLVVRDESGRWTKEYAEVMETMSIPVV